MSNQQLDLDSLSLEQLGRYKQEEEQKLQQVTGHYGQLRAAQARFVQSKDTLQQMQESDAGKEVMVPLTQSLYVPGKIVEPTKVTVELGTGFYAEKTTKEAIAFLGRKIDLVNKNAESIHGVVTGTKRNVDAIVMCMQGKIQELQNRGA